MATFEVKTHKVTIKEHPNADALEIAKIEGYSSIVPKGTFSNGDIVVYIPEQSIVPEKLIEELGLTGRLAGKAKNRVKAIRLRGVLSQGLIYPNKGNWILGELLNDILGITKYEPPIPIALAGEVDFVSQDYTIKYDIENFKNHINVLQDGELIQITEKIHGTFTMISAVPSDWGLTDSDKLIDGRFIVASKGLGGRGLIFKDNEKNINNLYLKTAKELNLFEKVGELADRYGTIVTIAGEIFGQGIQDLQYGFNKAQFRLFDIAFGKERVDKRYFDNDVVEAICEEFDIQRVPVLYVGAFSKEVLDTYTNGKETVSGQASHIREGVVAKPLKERYSDGLGRVMLKSISEAYLLRKNATEFN
jgi:RNA ligase (TIGR02306 family)